MERNPHEKQNDRNDRAIRRAASWYASHLLLSKSDIDGKIPKIILLTDDENNRKIAQKEGIVCCTGIANTFDYMYTCIQYVNNLFNTYFIV